MAYVQCRCGDASNTWEMFSLGLGMCLIAKSDQTTGNETYCSYVIQSNEVMFAFTTPYSSKRNQTNTKMPHPSFQNEMAQNFVDCHGLAIRAIGILVNDVKEAYQMSVEKGSTSISTPQVLIDEQHEGKMMMSEVSLYGDVVLRYVSKHGFNGSFLPNYEEVESLPLSYGLIRCEHMVGNVHNNAEVIQYISKFNGFHEFAKITNDHGCTKEEVLNNMVFASNDEMVLFPSNEPIIYGAKQKSNVQTYLERYEGLGLQHLALSCNDIFFTVREMHTYTHVGGFEFMPKPLPTYYQDTTTRVGVVLTNQQIEECEELGILVENDDQGVLLQIFIKPIGDRYVL